MIQATAWDKLSLWVHGPQIRSDSLRAQGDSLGFGENIGFLKQEIKLY